MVGITPGAIVVLQVLVGLLLASWASANIAAEV